MIWLFLLREGEKMQALKRSKAHAIERQVETITSSLDARAGMESVLSLLRKELSHIKRGKAGHNAETIANSRSVGEKYKIELRNVRRKAIRLASQGPSQNENDKIKHEIDDLEKMYEGLIIEEIKSKVEELYP